MSLITTTNQYKFKQFIKHYKVYTNKPLILNNECSQMLDPDTTQTSEGLSELSDMT